jgi:hypothetical protein
VVARTTEPPSWSIAISACGPRASRSAAVLLQEGGGLGVEDRALDIDHHQAAGLHRRHRVRVTLAR